MLHRLGCSQSVERGQPNQTYWLLKHPVQEFNLVQYVRGLQTTLMCKETLSSLKRICLKVDKTYDCPAVVDSIINSASFERISFRNILWQLQLIVCIDS